MAGARSGNGRRLARGPPGRGRAGPGRRGAGGAWLLNWLSGRRDKNRDAAAAANRQSIDEWKEIVARQDAHIAELQRSQDNCQRREARLSRVAVYLHGIARQHQQALAAMGAAVEPVMDIKDLLDDPAAAEFAADTNRQNTLLLHEEAKRAAQTEPPP